MLQKTNIPITLGNGINTKVDNKQLQGSLLKMENATITKTGEIQKRNGFTSLGNSVLGGVDITSALKITSFNNELLLIDRRSLYSYASQSNKWINKGPCPTTSVSTSNIIANSYQQLNPDMCYSNNTSTYAWEDSRGGVRAVVIDENSGAKIVQDIELNATGSRPKCFAIGQFHFVFYFDSSTGNLICRRVDTLDPRAFGNENIISTDINSTTPIYDVCLIGTSRMVVAYRNALSQLQISYVLLTGAAGGLSNGVPAPLAFAGIDPNTCITVVTGIRDNQKDTFFVSWFNSTTGLEYIGLYNDFTTYKSRTVIDSSVSPLVRNITGICYQNEFTSQKRFDLFWERTNALDIKHYVERSNIDITTNTFSPIVVFQRSAGLASKAYRSDSSTRVTCSYQSAEGFQDTYFSLSDSSQLFSEGWGYNWGNNWGGYGIQGDKSVIQAKILSTLAGGHTNKVSQLPGVWNLGDSSFTMAGLRKTRVVADNVSTFTLKGINQLILNHQAVSVGVPFQLGQNLHIPGGFLKMYDGESVTEHSFHLYPESVSSAVGTSGSIANGTYQHVVVWEWIDAKGQIHRSAPSIPVSTTLTGANDEIVLTIPTLRYTLKTFPYRSEVIASVYRTTNGGTNFYKVSNDSSPLYNDTESDSITFNDTLIDSSILSRPLLYTTGGTLENTPVSACDIVVPFKNRLFAAGLESESELRYSKEFVKDEGVAFSEALTVAANSGGGGIKALAVLDEKLVIFKENKIFILSGNGPTDTGSDNDFQSPQEVSSDVGCVEPESIVNISKGILFKSQKGIYLLDRGLTVSYIGDRVQDYNNLDISSAVVIPELNQVRFTSREGTTQVYDYYYDSWSVYTNQPAVSATSWNGEYVYLKDSGITLKEVVGSYSDDGVAIKTKIETSWISVAGLQGFQRLYSIMLLGNYVGSHTLKATLSYDFRDYSTESFTIIPSQVVIGSVFGSVSPYGSEATFGSGTGVYQFEIKPANQKCSSFKLTIEDLFPDSTGTGGFTINSVSSTIGVKRGMNKLNSNQIMR